MSPQAKPPRADALAFPRATRDWSTSPTPLTAFRLVLVVPFGIALMSDGGADTTGRLLATVIFIVASITDWLDGYYARKRHIVTTFGKIADPIADKLLTGTAPSSDCPSSASCRGGSRSSSWCARSPLLCCGSG